MTNRWEQLAQLDPLFVVLAEHGKKHGGWDPEEFFETGTAEVNGALARYEELGGSVPDAARALDFGCGVGRLTLALADHAAHVTGVDISPRMIALAQEFGGGREGVDYVLNEVPDLTRFADGSFDLVYTTKVMFHLKPALQDAFLREFFRVLAPGGALIFGASTFTPAPTAWRAFHARYKSARRRWLPQRMRFSVLRAVGFRPQWLYKRFGWRPMMGMYTVPEGRLQRTVDACGGQTLGVDKEQRRIRMNTTWYVRSGDAAP